MELTAEELWSRIRDVAEGSIPEQAFRTWLAPARASTLSSTELVLDVPSRFHVEWIEDKYGPMLDKAAEHVLGRSLSVAVTCGTETSPIPVP